MQKVISIQLSTVATLRQVDHTMQEKDAILLKGEKSFILINIGVIIIYNTEGCHIILDPANKNNKKQN